MTVEGTLRLLKGNPIVGSKPLPVHRGCGRRRWAPPGLKSSPRPGPEVGTQPVKGEVTERGRSHEPDRGCAGPLGGRTARRSIEPRRCRKGGGRGPVTASPVTSLPFQLPAWAGFRSPGPEVSQGPANKQALHFVHEANVLLLVIFISYLFAFYFPFKVCGF